MALFFAFDISKDMHIYLLLNGGISDIYLDLFTIPFLCLPLENFSQDSCGCVWGGLRDEKERKKSPLVSAPQKQHLEPSCHPTWIKGPSVVAAGLLTWCLTLGWGVGGGRGWGRG